MNKTALAFGIGASLILAAGSASAAGSCGAEVAALQQQLGHQDSANATIGATDPGVQQPSPTASADTSTTTSPTSDQVAESNSGANATIGATDPGVQQPAPEANAATGTSTTTTTDGSSTTTADNTGANATIGPTDPGVQQPQNTDATADSSGSSTTTTESGTTTADSSATMPSGDVTETSRVGDLNTAAGGHAEAITALKKAQLAADAGDEATCRTELGTAKAAMGVQ
jgi:mucin-22